jgi:hypothetical protein
MRRIFAPCVAFLGSLPFTHLFGLSGVAAALAFDIALWHNALLSLHEAYPPSASSNERAKSIDITPHVP